MERESDGDVPIILLKEEQQSPNVNKKLLRTEKLHNYKYVLSFICQNIFNNLPELKQ